MARLTDGARGGSQYRRMQEVTLERSWRDRLASLAGRRRDAWLVVALAAAAVVVGVLMWGRAPAARVATPATAASPAPAAPGAGASPTGASVVLVHVAGAVRRPGLYELPAGARLADAIEAAGGARAGAQLDALNLAEALADGQKVEVLGRGTAAAAVAPAPGVPGPTPSSAPLVDLNTADQVALETIPGIGPVTATAILEYREQVGWFTAVEQLLEVSGIGPATLESMRPYVTL